MKPGFRIMIYIVVGYVLFAAIITWQQRNFLYFPDRAVPDPQRFGAPETLIVPEVITADGLVLKGWYFPAQPNRPTLLWFHGNAQSHATRILWIRPYLDAGYGVLLAGYRGYGGNPGSPSEEGFYRDAEAWLAYLTENQEVPRQELALYGESLGSGVAVEMALRHEFGALVLQAPYTSLVAMAFHYYPILPVRYLLLDQFDSISKIPDVTEPLLIVHGARDRVIPIKYGRMLFDAASEPKQFAELPLAGHNDLYNHEIAEKVMHFLDNKMQKKNGTDSPQ